MVTTEPVIELDAPYSGEGATPTPWATTADHLADAQIYWLSTVRADGRPHVTPVIGVWSSGVMHVCTGPDEQKARNLAANQDVVVTTGVNEWRGLDVVTEGTAERVTDENELSRLAAEYESKYGTDWHFDVADGTFTHDAGHALVFRIPPTKIYAYDRDEPGAATRYRF